MLSMSTFAEPAPEKTLLTVTLYAEPRDEVQHFAYTLKLPPDEYYSIYHGSDLPTWHFEKKNIATGKFRSVELINIRIHPTLAKKTANSQADLTITDSKYARIIWQGQLTYGVKKPGQFTKKFANEKYYETQIKYDSKINAIKIEINNR